MDRSGALSIRERNVLAPLLLDGKLATAELKLRYWLLQGPTCFPVVIPWGPGPHASVRSSAPGQSAGGGATVPRRPGP